MGFGTRGPWLYKLYLQEILFIHPKYLDFSNLGVNPIVACGTLVVAPS
jgi:hypothetical protein